MSTKIIATIGALSLAAVSSFAQGSIHFANTDTVINPYTSAAADYSADAAGHQVIVELFYSTASTAPAPLTYSVLNTASFPNGWQAVDASTRAGANYPLAPGENAPGNWSEDLVLSGAAPAANVWLQAIAWTGTLAIDGNTLVATGNINVQNAGQSKYFGTSTVWSEKTGTTTAPANFGYPGSLSFTLVPVPEPSTIALAGLGAASLMLFRRRK